MNFPFLIGMFLTAQEIISQVVRGWIPTIPDFLL